MILKRCGPQDADVVRELSIQTFRETFDAHNSEENMRAYLEEAFNPGKLASELVNPASAFYLAMDGERAAGYLKVNHAGGDGERSTELERIYVLREYLGTGCGRLLLEKAVELAREEGGGYLWLGVWEHNERARKFYEKHGFKQYGEHEFRLGDDVQTDLLMRLELT